MKMGFKDALEVKKPKKMKSPWTYDAPHYDQRSGCFIEAGDNHGVGHRTPVGSEKVTKSYSSVIPSSPKKDTMKTDFINRDGSYQVDIDV